MGHRPSLTGGLSRDAEPVLPTGPDSLPRARAYWARKKCLPVGQPPALTTHPEGLRGYHIPVVTLFFYLPEPI